MRVYSDRLVERRGVVTAITRSRPDLRCAAIDGMPVKCNCTCPPSRSLAAGAAAL